ncbi:DUF397 domain-containing protein [Streptomyces sp. SID12501]|uniref:DUF397 domain-containing protein n=1 Tax=Streptomyces sp. SID12501 TaxID=2706042 RepID=A0A6B3BK52_9ACTN|nr:DUF397 domain-containing protein [Streptomyces sp. SID12501]NEC85748.1 DUF397 domain-containing protein [Streptomyces sp. SID12501]
MSTARSKDDGPPTWFTSSYSNGAGGECVECARTGDGALVRDSKSTGGPVIVVRGQGWQTFIRALNKRELKGWFRDRTGSTA